MKTLFKKFLIVMKNLFEKYIIVKYILKSYVKVMLYSLAIFIATFLILQLLGIYAQIEGALDIKYSSPFILVPLYGFISLSLICFFIGFLMYYYKYKRSITKGTFYKNFSIVLNQKQIKKN